MSANLNPQAAKVFISYSHRDNIEGDDTSESGWMAAFVRNLSTTLKQRAQAEVWWDHRIAGNEPLSWVLSNKLRNSAALLAMVSPGYVQSKWCQDELAWFIQHHGHAARQSLFAAEVLPLTKMHSLHPALVERKRSKFWGEYTDSGVPYVLNSSASIGKATDIQAYWKQLNELAHWLGEHIGNLPPTQPTGRTKVWIAPTTDDVHPRWEELAAALRQAGCEVLPTGDVEDARSDAELRDALRPALDEAAVLVQLLGATPGRVRGSLGAPLHQCLHPLMREAAQQRHLPMWVWRPPELQPPTVADAAHRQLLTGTTACGFQEFIGLVQQAVQAQAEPKAPPAPTEPGHAMAAAGESAEVPTVCLTADAVDHPLSEKVADVLADLGAMVVTPTAVADHADPSAWRQHNDALMSEADGLLLLYGQAPASWVQSQLLAARKTLSQRRSRTRLSLLDAPPPQKPAAAWRLPNLLTLDCRQGLQREPLARFVDQLRAGGQHV